MELAGLVAEGVAASRLGGLWSDSLTLQGDYCPEWWTGRKDSLSVPFLGFDTVQDVTFTVRFPI